MQKHEWRENTADGKTRLVTATRHGGKWKLRARLKSDEDWTLYPVISLEDLETLRELVFNKYNRKRLPYDQVLEIDTLIRNAKGRANPAGPSESTHQEETTMDIRNAMLEEYHHESKLTRSVIEATPDSLLDFKPEESMHDVRWNVSHLVDIPDWTDMILNQAEFDVAPVGQPPHQTLEMQSIAEALDAFDRNTASAKKLISTFDLTTLEDEWSLKLGGQTLLTHPRHLIYRMYLISHVAHHRGHLLVYLRLNGIETPRLYG